MRMSSAKKNPYKNTNETQTGQGCERIRESQGSVYVSNVWNTQRFNSPGTIGLVTQDRPKQFNIKMGRAEHDQSVQGMSSKLGAGYKPAYEFGYRPTVWRRHNPAFREYGTAISNLQGDISGLGGISIKVRGLLQEKTKTDKRRGLQSVGLYCKHIYRFWFENKRGSQMINNIERAVVFSLLAGLSTFVWYIIYLIATNYVTY